MYCILTYTKHSTRCEILKSENLKHLRYLALFILFYFIYLYSFFGERSLSKGYSLYLTLLTHILLCEWYSHVWATRILLYLLYNMHFTYIILKRFLCLNELSHNNSNVLRNDPQSFFLSFTTVTQIKHFYPIDPL